MLIKSLYSGSAGNATFVEKGDIKLLIECGVSFKKLAEAYDQEVDPTAIFISHAHGDHVRGAGIAGRKTGTPIYIPEASYKEVEHLFKNCEMKFITGGNNYIFGDLQVDVFSTKHDSAASVGFTITDTIENKKFGYLTDTGAINRLMKHHLNDCDALFLEADFDDNELEKYAEYDEYLKERIRSPIGHLSNDKAIDYIKSLDINKLQWVIFGHLSKNTNSVDLLTEQIHTAFAASLWNKFHIAHKPLNLEIL